MAKIQASKKYQHAKNQTHAFHGISEGGGGLGTSSSCSHSLRHIYSQDQCLYPGFVYSDVIAYAMARRTGGGQCRLPRLGTMEVWSSLRRRCQTEDAPPPKAPTFQAHIPSFFVYDCLTTGLHTAANPTKLFGSPRPSL